MALPFRSTDMIYLHDTPFLLKQSANYFSLLFKQTLISPLSCCSLIVDISTSSLRLATWMMVFALSCSDLLQYT